MTPIHLLCVDMSDPLSNYANSAERHPRWFVSLCDDRESFDLYLAASSCPSTTPINRRRSWSWPCQSAAPARFPKWEKVYLASSTKAAEIAEDETSFPGWVLGVCPGHLGQQRMMRKQPKTVSENTNLCFLLAKNGPAVSLSSPKPKCSMFAASQTTSKTCSQKLFLLPIQITWLNWIETTQFCHVHYTQICKNGILISVVDHLHGIAKKQLHCVNLKW